jgi:hypothetical protein
VATLAEGWRGPASRSGSTPQVILSDPAF